ncbi:MAG: YdeI/OmpD-associated family protein [Ignavibacteriaceae bacterium]
MTPIFFSNQSEFRKWLAKNYKKETELLVGYYKVDTGKPSMTWSQSVDQALCYGWIDGVRKSLDDESYCIRFTPRKPTSNWSAINIKKVEELVKQGLMQTAGLEAFNFRKEEKSNIYSFENIEKKLSDSLKKKFKANNVAWDFFAKQAHSYQKTMMHWIMSAKRDGTKLSRLEKVITESEKQKRIGDQYKKKSEVKS